MRVEWQSWLSNKRIESRPKLLTSDRHTKDKEEWVDKGGLHQQRSTRGQRVDLILFIELEQRFRLRFAIVFVFGANFINARLQLLHGSLRTYLPGRKWIEHKSDNQGHRDNGQAQILTGHDVTQTNQ